MEKNNNLNEAFLEVLAESPLFREIEKKELHAMLVCLGGQIKEYKKGTSIFRWGDTISKIGFVLKADIPNEPLDGMQFYNIRDGFSNSYL